MILVFAYFLFKFNKELTEWNKIKLVAFWAYDGVEQSEDLKMLNVSQRKIKTGFEVVYQVNRNNISFFDYFCVKHTIVLLQMCVSKFIYICFKGQSGCHPKNYSYL